MTVELPNLRAALRFALVRPEGHTALELAGALWFFWYPCGFLQEGRHFLERALAQDRAPGPARRKAQWACALVLVCQGEGRSRRSWPASARPRPRRRGTWRRG
ncbi:hypothetical protein ACFQ0B_72160 [Nonomuraea thailandensis]